MSTVDDNELASIKSLLVEKDSTNSARYWIWFSLSPYYTMLERLVFQIR